MRKRVYLLIGFLLFSISLFSQEKDSIRNIELNEVTISAFGTKSNIKQFPHKVEVIQKKDIQNIPSDNVGDILKKTSGIDIIEYPGFQANIGMRGFPPTGQGNTYTLMLVNGIPAGSRNIATLDLNNVEQIEVLKGPFSSFFGSGAMAGVINIVTPKSKGKIQGETSVSYGSFQTFVLKANVGGKISGNFNFDLSAKLNNQNKDYKTGSHNVFNLSSTEKQIMDDKSYGQVFDNTTFKNYTTNLRLGYDINKNWQINLYENLFIANKVLLNGNFWGVYGSNQRDINRLSQSLSIEGNVGNHSLRISPYISKEVDDLYNNISDTNFVSSSYIYKTYGFNLQDEYTFDKHKIIVGLDNFSQNFNSKQWSDATTPQAPYQPDYANISYGLFTQLRFVFLDNKLNTSIGTRYDYMKYKTFKTNFIESENSAATYNTVNPNIGVKYEIVDGLNISGSAGTAFFAPDAFKKTGSYTWGIFKYKGNPNLKPEESFTYDFGVSYSNQKKGVWASITYFNTNHKGLLVYDYSNLDYTTFKNADKAKMNGLEISLAYDFGNFSQYKYSFKLYCNLTHLVNTDVTINNVKNDMKYVRKNNASFGIEYRNFKNISARLNGRFIGSRYEDNWLYNYSMSGRIPYTTTDGYAVRSSLINDDVLKHPNFMVFDFSSSYTLYNKYMVGFSIMNLLDENYTEKDTYYMPGRMFTGSLTFKF
ncbi:MAG: TonB-dependent receptor [Bacteroidales bacterium]|nr:TonB-dependent receptor [Bacteroidales bacterium]